MPCQIRQVIAIEKTADDTATSRRDTLESKMPTSLAIAWRPASPCRPPSSTLIWRAGSRSPRSPAKIMNCTRGCLRELDLETREGHLVSSNPILICVPSQKGLFPEPPHVPAKGKGRRLRSFFAFPIQELAASFHQQRAVFQYLDPGRGLIRTLSRLCLFVS